MFSGSAGTEAIAAGSTGAQPRARRRAPPAPQELDRRAAAPAQAVWARFVAGRFFPGPHAKTDYWQIPRERCAVAPPRQARRSVSTSRTRSRRTENGNLGAWRGEFRLRRGVCEGPGASGNAVTTKLAAFATQRARPARSESGWFENTAGIRWRLLQIGGANASWQAGKRFLNPMRLRCNALPRHHKMPESGRITRICLECAAIFGHLPLTVRWRLGVYTRAMMIKRILTICAAVAAGAAASSLALAQGYPVPPASVYSTAPLPYPSGGYPDYRRAPTELDADLLEDDEALPNAQRSTALPPPGPGLSPDDPRYGRPIYSDRSAPTGPILSPDDPRYGRPAGAPAYSDRSAPTGPILSPDDPRYGRPAGAPPVYSDRGAPTGPILSPDDPRYGRPEAAPPVYSDRGAPTGPILSPDDPRYGRPDGPPPVIYSDRGNVDGRIPGTGRQSQ